MDAYQTDTAGLAYSSAPPVLIAASSATAMATAERAILAAGLRVGARSPIELAKSRLGQQLSMTAVWVELDEERSSATDDLLQHLNRSAREGHSAAVVSTTVALLDEVAAQIDEDAIEIVVDGNDADRAAALAIATTQREMPLRISDVAGDKSADRLRVLSEEVSRIASTLARLSSGPGQTRPLAESAPAADAPPLSADIVRNVIRARRLRARYFDEELFADPAWDMLLDLLQAEIAQLRVPVSSLCIAAAVPATTALRWLKTLVAKEIFIRRADPHDGRRVFVELAPVASQALRRYFADIGSASVI